MPLEYDKEDYPNPPFVAWAPNPIFFAWWYV
jgi:hypothetical protein